MLNIRNILALLIFLILITPINSYSLDKKLEKHLLLFTHYIATSANSYTPEIAPQVSDKIVNFTLGHEKTSLRNFFIKQAEISVSDNITYIFTPEPSTFKLLNNNEDLSIYHTSISGIKTSIINTKDENIEMKSLITIKLEITKTQVTKSNPFGLVLLKYDEVESQQVLK